MIPEALVLNFLDDLDAKMQAVMVEFGKIRARRKARRRDDGQGVGAGSAANAEHKALAARREGEKPAKAWTVMKSFNQPDCFEELNSRIDQLRVDTPRKWGKMNAPQMICHLTDSFRGVMGRKLISMPERRSGWRLTKWFALSTPVKWPQGVPTRPEMDQLMAGTRPGEFEADVRDLKAIMVEFARQPREFEFQPHPIFLELTEKEWMRWGYRHVDHHLRQFGL